MWKNDEINQNVPGCVSSSYECYDTHELFFVSPSGFSDHWVRCRGSTHPDGLPAADPGSEEPARRVCDQSEAAAASNCHRATDTCPQWDWEGSTYDHTSRWEDWDMSETVNSQSVCRTFSWHNLCWYVCLVQGMWNPPWQVLQGNLMERPLDHRILIIPVDPQIFPPASLHGMTPSTWAPGLPTSQ